MSTCTHAGWAQTTVLIDLPEAEVVRSIEFLPGGQGLAVEARVRAINIWELLHHYWPEELGFLFAASAMVLLGAILYVRTHPQRAGEPLCRKCGYSLLGLSGGQCPECGSRKRFVGRTALRRLRSPLVVAAFLGGLYACMLITGVGRWSPAYDWFNWRSVDLVTLAREHDQAWLLSRCESFNTRLVLPMPPANDCVPVSMEDVSARSMSLSNGPSSVESDPMLGRSLASAHGFATRSGDAVVNLRIDEQRLQTLQLRGVPYDDPIRAMSLSPEPSEFAVAVENLNRGGKGVRVLRVGVFRLPRGTTDLR